MTIGIQKTGTGYTMEVFTKGSFIHKMIVVRQTQEFLVEVETDE